MEMNLLTLVGNAATFFTIGVFLSGIQICQRIFRKKSTAEISALPFICGFVNCSLWLRYGIFTRDSVVITVNITGCVLQLLYIMCYSSFLTNKEVFAKQLLGALSILAFLFFYTTIWLSDEAVAMKVAGISACTAGVMFVSSPLSSLAHVIKMKNVECLPFYMILFSFIMASLWFWYGILVKDMFIQVPNFLGAVVSLCQLSLFVIYPSKKPYFEFSTTA